MSHPSIKTSPVISGKGLRERFVSARMGRFRGERLFRADLLLRLILLLGAALSTLAWSGAASATSSPDRQPPKAPASSPAADIPENPIVLATSPPLAVTPVVVTVSRFKQERFEADRSVQIVDDKSVRELQANSAPSALQETTGVLVQQTNRGSGAPVIRGLIGPRNLILIDGVRLNNATFRTGPHQYLALLDPVNFSRFEVMMGPASLLYGSDAMGGVLQGVVRDWPRDETRRKGEAGLRFSSPDMSTALWGHGTVQQRGLGVMMAGALRRHGTLTAGQGEIQPLSDYLTGGWSLRVRRDLGSKTQLTASWVGGRIRDAGRADRINKGDLRHYDNDDDLAWIRLRHEGKGLLRHVQVTASLHRTAEVVTRWRCVIDDFYCDPQRCADAVMQQRQMIGGREESSASGEAPITQQTLFRDEVWSPGALALAQLGLLQGRASLSLGAEGYLDEITDSTRRDRRLNKDWNWSYADRGDYSKGSQQLSLAAFFLLEADLWTSADDALIAHAGGRLGHTRSTAEDVPGVGDLRHEYTGVVGSLGLRWLHGKHLMAYINASQGFRSPNLQETTVLGDTGSKFELPNDTLRPERTDSLEVGGRYRLGEAALHLAAFFSELRDVIDEEPLDEQAQQELGLSPAELSDKPVVQRVNRPGGRFVGSEVTLSGPALWGLRPWIRASWIRGEIHREDTTVPARRVPPAMGSAGLRYSPGQRRWYLELFSRFARAQDRLHPSDELDLRICEDPNNPGHPYPDGTCQGTPGWWTINLRGGLIVAEHLYLDASLGNLLDAQYRTHGSGFDQPGRGLTTSIVGRF